MVFPTMVNLNYRELLTKGDNRLLGTSQAINFLVIPLVAFSIGSLFFRNHPMILIGFMLMSVLPTSGMTISWTGFAKGNIHAAIKITIISLLVGALLAPFILKLYLGTVMRNLSVALAIAMTAFPKGGADIALIIAVAYIFQVQMAAGYIHIAPKLFASSLQTELN